jgi:hypothetical protein
VPGGRRGFGIPFEVLEFCSMQRHLISFSNFMAVGFGTRGHEFKCFRLTSDIVLSHDSSPDILHPSCACCLLTQVVEYIILNSFCYFLLLLGASTKPRFKAEELKL